MQKDRLHGMLAAMPYQRLPAPNFGGVTRIIRLRVRQMNALSSWRLLVPWVTVAVF